MTELFKNISSCDDTEIPNENNTATETTISTPTSSPTLPSSSTSSTTTPSKQLEERTSENVIPREEKGNNDDQTTVVPFVVKAPRADSKLILKNMEEVLNSVKRKHKQKHKRLKEQKKRAQMEACLLAAAAAASAIDGEDSSTHVTLTPTIAAYQNGLHHDHSHQIDDDLSTVDMRQMDINGDVSNEPDESTIVVKSNKKHGNYKHKNALKEKIPLENGISRSGSGKNSHSKGKHKSNKRSPIKLASKSPPNESILKHFQKTPKKNETDQLKESSNNNLKSAKPNAFEMMMNARNKSIGTNSSGIEILSPPQTEEAVNPTNIKRKLMLQEWADRKGAAKRKLEEDAREVYVEQQLEQRAKKLKQMLVNGPNSKSPTKASGKKADNVNGFSLSQGVEKPKRRGKPAKVKRAESLDIEHEIVDEKTNDSETSEFLSKLNSPTKKRDSLLAYFPKKVSPSQLISKSKKSTSDAALTVDSPVAAVTKKEVLKINDKNETPKRRPRRSAAINNNVMNEVDLTPSTALSLDETPSSSANSSVSRPRRSCTGKARYDYDLEKSPVKKDRQSKNSKLATPVTSLTANHLRKDSQELNNDEIEGQAGEIDVIVLDDSSISETFNQSANTPTADATPKKLAPLFIKAVPKPSVDPQVLKARQEFLRSGVPEKLRLEQIKQKQFEQNYEDSFEFFPKICHVQQYSEEEKEILAKSFPTSNIISKLKPNTFEEDVEEEELGDKILTPTRTNKRRSRTNKSYTFGLLTNCSNQNFKDCLQNKLQTSMPATQIMPLPSLENKRNVIKSWKNSFERFPTYKCYNQMREKYRYFSAVDSEQDTQQVSESLVVTRRTTRRSLEAQKLINADGSEEEAKPPPTAPNGEILFTEKYKPLMFEQVLVNLTPVTQLKEFLSSWAVGNNGTPRNSQNMDDSMELANDSNSSHTSVCNSVVLLGPVSSGKTNAVLALANEMNFNVLEINAGMKRTGKKLIQELQEATQSHQIKKETKSQKHLLKMSLNGLKGKKSLSGSPSTGSSNALISNGNSQDMDMSSELGQNSRKCLILIEDADIVFDQTDAGFVDAIYTLAASSKRPVILVASNPNCSHLQRLMQQNTIVFNPPNVLNISRYLAVLALIENCPIQLDDLISLHLYNKKDLRKTMLQLQFFIQSGGDRSKYLLNRKETPLRSKRNSSENSHSSNVTSKGDNQQFYASPTKKKITEEDESDSNQKPDENLEKTKIKDSHNKEVVMHKCLFEFYTTNQNEKLRVPFPVDLNLLRINLKDILQNASFSKKVSEEMLVSSPLPNGKPKRTSRSPKKEWINTATAASTAAMKALEEAKKSSMKNISSFYENISAAYLCNGHYDANDEPKDRLVSHLSEEITHTLVEKAISTNLEADLCPYNLFDTPEKLVSLTDNLGNMVMRTKRARHLDFEPCLRNICRSEKLRSSLERRSTRFYHYLRNVCVNASSFSLQEYDDACGIFQSQVEDPDVNANGPSDSTQSKPEQ